MELKELGELDDEEWEEEGRDSVEEGNNHESEADQIEKGSEEGPECEANTTQMENRMRRLSPMTKRKETQV